MTLDLAVKKIKDFVGYDTSIILSSSRAYGTYNEYSDWDFTLIGKQSRKILMEHQGNILDIHEMTPDVIREELISDSIDSRVKTRLIYMPNQVIEDNGDVKDTIKDGLTKTVKQFLSFIGKNSNKPVEFTAEDLFKWPLIIRLQSEPEFLEWVNRVISSDRYDDILMTQTERYKSILDDLIDKTNGSYIYEGEKNPVVYQTDTTWTPSLPKRLFAYTYKTIKYLFSEKSIIERIKRVSHEELYRFIGTINRKYSGLRMIGFDDNGETDLLQVRELSEMTNTTFGRWLIDVYTAERIKGKSEFKKKFEEKGKLIILPYNCE